MAWITVCSHLWSQQVDSALALQSIIVWMPLNDAVVWVSCKMSSGTACIPSDLYMSANVSGKPFYSELPSGNLRQLYSHEFLRSKAGSSSRSLCVMEK